MDAPHKSMETCKYRTCMLTKGAPMTPSGPTPFPRMIRGSVVVQRRRCGTPSCRCSDGEQLHESTVLSYSTAGRGKTLMLTPDQIERARTSVARYRAAQAKLDEQASAD
jgi:hypothetical protein